MRCRRQVWPFSQPGMVQAKLQLCTDCTCPCFIYHETSTLDISMDPVTSNQAAVGCFITCSTSVCRSIFPSLTQNLKSRLIRSSSLLARLELALQLAANVSSQSKKDSHQPSCGHPTCHRSHSNVREISVSKSRLRCQHSYSDNRLWGSDCPQQQASAGPATTMSSLFLS